MAGDEAGAGCWPGPTTGFVWVSEAVAGVADGTTRGVLVCTHTLKEQEVMRVASAVLFISFFTDVTETCIKNFTLDFLF